ncbi:unnamed protein product [Bursaphelenchus xylophilus]|uniref:Ubiquitin-like modifier-activating enzyme ATG7 n=1 Tax=Bursaphelenchus xylophilus TaxID=6326 RepID=A0A1I7S3W6_BURXY|nr:unnamed protein product [Bursaphelenchus xylophilus]CAG9116537.1 unnamed protein product [Bursaphelenchus xylophilus]
MAEVKFVPFKLFIDPAFWSEINRRRLDEWQLECPELPIKAGFDFTSKKGSSCPLSISFDALNGRKDVDTLAIGKFKLFGTLKDFQNLDRKALSSELRDKLWDNVRNFKTSELSPFYVAAFADLKQYLYYYILCAPALAFPAALKRSSTTESPEAHVHAKAWQYFKDTAQTASLLLENSSSIIPLEKLKEVNGPVTVVFLNPTSVPEHLGWTARNLLALIAYSRPDWTNIKLLALRNTVESSFLVDISWSKPDLKTAPETVGWQKPELISLKNVFDPVKLMESAVDMNLKLVRWRLVPELKLSNLTDLKVLIVGSGTLGCNLARNFLGWGVKHFTFIDNSVVSFNNPVRQSLFTFEDAKQGNKSKSLTAAESLKKIYPSVYAEGLEMKIPMPSHPISEKEREGVKKTVSELCSLIREHDVVFLVMDSRESRWLPTLLCTHFGKLAVTVALGFDSFMVMRHGVRTAKHTKITEESEVPGSELGCYFCSDVTAPGNSMEDRTLDQNCTITRAGISGIASGMAVELVASLTQHDLGAGAPALKMSVDHNSTVLGGTPHQIRGFMSTFHFMTPTVRRFDRCTACGDNIQNEFAANGFDFLEKVFNDSSHLENISGLRELQESVDKVSIDDIDLSCTDSE